MLWSWCNVGIGVVEVFSYLCLHVCSDGRMNRKTRSPGPKYGFSHRSKKVTERGCDVNAYCIYLCQAY